MVDQQTPRGPQMSEAELIIGFVGGMIILYYWT